MTLNDIHLVLYGQTYTFGLVRSQARSEAECRLETGDARGFLALAQRHGLGGVEFGPRDFPELEEVGAVPCACPARRGLAEEVRARGLRVVVALGYPDPDAVRAAAAHARLFGAHTIRCVGSGILCGERRRAEPDWDTYRERLRQDLRRCVPLLEEHDCVLALENHQDLDSAELVDLCATTSPDRVGVTLDTGNPLAVAEDILDFAARVQPHVRNVHLKDYRVQMTDEGYRLVRCALGEGVVDFPGLFALLANAPQQPTLGIELAALQARHIRANSEDYWTTFPPDRRSGYPRLSDWLRARSEPADWDYRTSWEREAPPEEMLDYERTQLERSVAYLRTILEARDDT